MNYVRLALAFLGATIAYFAFGFAMFAALPAMKSEFMKYPDVYRSKDSMMKMMPFGMIAILISIVVVAVLYAKLYPVGGGIASGLCLGALIGIFSVCTFVIHNYVNLNHFKVNRLLHSLRSFGSSNPWNRIWRTRASS